MCRYLLSLTLMFPLLPVIGCSQPDASAPSDAGPAAQPDSAGGSEPDSAGGSEPDSAGGSEPDSAGGSAPDSVGGGIDAGPEVADVEVADPSEYIEAVLALEGALVTPQTKVHLTSESADCDGQAQAFQWTVTQPEGSMSVLLPASTFPNPAIEANVAGDYTFELHAYGPDGELCMIPRVFLLSVTPDAALHIELLWHTDGDPDQTDMGPEAGADLDLHVRHPLGTDWFDMPFDCYWFNAQPNWGELDPMVDDDPGLDLDDTDGAGPENFNLHILEEDAEYTVMVHSWHEHGYGASEATVRVYLFGELAYESEPVTLDQHDAWEVGVANSDGFTPSEAEAGGPLITPDVNGPMLQP